jgi:hypothetical protein
MSLSGPIYIHRARHRRRPEERRRIGRKFRPNSFVRELSIQVVR